MHSRFFYLFIIAAMAASPAFAADDGASASPSTAPIAKIDKNVQVEPPPEESRIQIPDMPHQDHLGEKPPTTGEGTAAKPDSDADKNSGLRVSLTPAPVLEKGKEATFVLGLTDKDDHPVTDGGLVKVHTKKIHLLIVDESFSDYQHVHPVPARDTWNFSFTPKTAHNYKIWVDVKPRGGDEQMLPLFLKGKEPCKESCVDKTEALTADFGEDKAQLSFDAPLTVEKPSTVTLTLTNKKGAPLKDLEPVLGAYAHVAAFSGDFSSVAHVHPMGDEPKDEKDRAASPLTFMIHPEKPGVLKIVVQIRRDDKDVFLYFTATVAASVEQAAPDSGKKP
jgi:hypothetical protein